MAEDPTLQQFLQSEEFLGQRPETQSQLLNKFQKMTPKQRQEIVQALTPRQQFDVGRIEPVQEGSGKAFLQREGHLDRDPVVPPVDPMGDLQKELAPGMKGIPLMAIGGAFGTGGAMAGQALAKQVGSSVAKKVLPLGGEIAGSYLGNQASKALDLQPGTPFGSFDTSDYLSVGLPVALKAGAGIAKATTRPAQKALQTADDINADIQRIRGEHQDALTIPQDVKAQIQLTDPQKLYNASKAAAPGGQLVSLPSFEQEAARLGVNLRSPADPLQSRFANITEALGEWATDPQPLQRVIDTHQRLGRVIGSTRGPEKGVAKRLWASMLDDMTDAAAQDPTASKAIEAYRKAQEAQRKQRAMEDFVKLFRVKRGHTNKPGLGKEVKSESILNNFEDLVENDPFFKGSFSPQELQAMREGLERLPTERLPKELSVEPHMDKAPIALAIAAKSIGSYTLPALGTGAGFAAGGPGGALAGAVLGGGAAITPYLVSRIMMSGPKGQQIVRNIMAGKETIGPKERAALTAAAKALGIPLTEE